jgi:hypothetical protein
LFAHCLLTDNLFAISSRRVRVSSLSFPNLFAGILFLGLLAMTARTATDPDVWWHLRTGQWMVENAQVPHADPFSFTRAGDPWVSHEWLSEIIFYGIWRWSGWAGLIAFSSLVTTAGFMLLYARCCGGPVWAAAATVLGALAAAPAWGVRPQMFTFLLTSILLWLLERGEKHPRRLLWLPVLFLPWLNLHAGFAMAPALLAAYLVGLAWEVARGRTRWQDVRLYFLRLWLALIACMTLVPLNPSGAKLYAYPLEVLRSAEMKAFILEWFSPDFHQGRYTPFLLIVLLLFFLVTVTRSRAKARVLFPLLATLAAALDAVRHIPIFVLVAVPVISAGLPTATVRWGNFPAKDSAKHRMRIAFGVAVMVLMAAFAATRWTLLSRSQSQAEAVFFPKAAVEFLQSHPAPERLFVYYDWGGYAIWKLYPQYRVFVDGRADLYGMGLRGRNQLRDFQAEMQLKPGWEKILDDGRVQTVLLPSSSAPAQALALQPGWLAMYRDSKAILFERREAGGSREIAFTATSIPGEKVQKSFAKLR